MDGAREGLQGLRGGATLARMIWEALKKVKVDQRTKRDSCRHRGASEASAQHVQSKLDFSFYQSGETTAEA